MLLILYMHSFNGGNEVRKIVCSIVCLCIVILLLLFFNYTQVRFDHNNIRIEGFYKEEKNSIDVVFIGASELYSDYYPVDAYEEYGYTSYNYAIEDNPVMFYKWELDEIYKFQHPKLVVIELSGAVSESELEQGSGYFDATLRKITDSTPLFGEKAKLISQYGNEKHQLSYYLPLMMYHTAKPSLGTAKEIFGFYSRGYSYLKGAVTHTNSKECSKDELYNVNNDNTTVQISEKQRVYLLDLLNHCKENNYQVVFARFPHRIENSDKYKRYCEGNCVAEIVQENGFDFLDFEQSVDETGIDKIQDFSDGEHLRASGAKKFTEYIGETLVKRYGIEETELSQNNEKKWNNCVRYSHGFYRYYNQIKDNKSDIFLYETNELIKECE